MKKISIITISYNSEKTIERTILSVLGQNYPELEYIIVDGKSTDRTMEIVNRYKDRISQIYSEPDRGISDAFNKGIRYATGEIIGFVNSDDVLQKGALEAVDKRMDVGVDVLYGNIIRRDEDSGWEYVEIPKAAELGEASLRSDMTILHPAAFIRASAYRQFGDYLEKYKCTMDRELLLRMYVGGAKFKYINEILSEFSAGGVSTKNAVRTIRELQEVSLLYGERRVRASLNKYKRCLKSYGLFLAKKMRLELMIRKYFVQRKGFRIIARER
jgi:glycosyltransferase involved in cell wall biosynthesis